MFEGPSKKIFSDVLKLEMQGVVAQVTIMRPEKRGALNETLVVALRDCFSGLPQEARVAVLVGDGEHFCAGLDLSELRDRSTIEGMMHSRLWHAAFEPIQFGRVPVVSVLKGAVVGGGLELASASHIRVAETSTFYALPEGQRGIFVGGGGSVRISRLIGVARMTDMMLTGRVYNAEEGHQSGMSQYLVPAGEGLRTAMELAQKIAANSATSNYGVLHVLPRIADQSIHDGLMTEALMAAVAQSDPQTRDRLVAFLDHKIGKIQRPK